MIKVFDPFVCLLSPGFHLKHWIKFGITWYQKRVSHDIKSKYRMISNVDIIWYQKSKYFVSKVEITSYEKWISHNIKRPYRMTSTFAPSYQNLITHLTKCRYVIISKVDIPYQTLISRVTRLHIKTKLISHYIARYQKLIFHLI